MEWVNVDQEHSASQRFKAEYDGLESVQVFLHQEGNPTQLTLTLKDSEGKILRQVIAQEPSSPSPTVYEFKFNPLKDSRGEVVYFSLTSPTPPQKGYYQVAFTTYGEGHHFSGEGYINDSQMPQDLYYTVTYQEHRGNLLGTFFIETVSSPGSRYILKLLSVSLIITLLVIFFLGKAPFLRPPASNRAFPILVLGISLVLHLFFAARQPVTNDEAFYLYDGLLISQGDSPFKYSAARAPGLIYPLAFYVKFLGRTLWAGRLLSISASLGTAVILYFLAKRWWNSQVGVWTFLTYLLAPFIITNYFYLHLYPLQFFFLTLAFLIVSKALKLHSNSAFFWAGVILGLAVLVRETALMFTPFFLILIFIENETLTKKLKVTFIFGLGLLTCFLIGWGLVAYEAGLYKVYLNLYALRTTTFDSPPFSSRFARLIASWRTNFLAFFITALFIFFGLKDLIERIGKRKVLRKKFQQNLVLLLLLGMPFVFYFFVYTRFEPEYFTDLWVWVTLMGGVVLARLYPHFRTSKFFRGAAIFLLILGVSSGYFHAYQNPSRGTHYQETVREVVTYLRENFSSTEEIFTGAVIFPFLSNNPLALNITHPSVYRIHTTVPDPLLYQLYPTEEEIINYLGINKVHLVITEISTRRAYMRNRPKLQGYIEDQYVKVKEIGHENPVTIMVRK